MNDTKCISKKGEKNLVGIDTDCILLPQTFIMQWQKFDKNCPQETQMIFLDNKRGWFCGKLINDSEYGLVISSEERYWGVEDITHYLIVELP